MSNELLIKYVRHIIECKSVDYTHNMLTDSSQITSYHTVLFTEQEVAEIKKIAEDYYYE